MKSIKLLDCTLRDGGFLNDWNFGEASIHSIFRRLVKSNVDIIEVGFIDARRNFDINRSINPDTESYNKLFQNETKGNSIIVGMIDFGTCPIENIQDKKDSFLDGIRVIFKKKDITEALKLCRQIKDKGYLVSVQPVSITTYSDREWLDLIDMVNELNPFAMSLVDTYGLLHKDKLFKYFNLLDDNLNSNIEIGYHAHNNFQLAYSNSIELLNINTSRNIIIDASLYGMGKSAGNLNIELIADFLNKVYDKSYDIFEIINTIDLEILNYTTKYKWGYQIEYYLSAINKCHPNYVKYLESKNTLPIKEINRILSQIPKEKSLTFDKDYVEQLYLKYQTKNLDDSSAYLKLKEALSGKSILLIGPGYSVKKEKEKIKNFILENRLVTIGVNHINNYFDINYTFISNVKRFDQLNCNDKNNDRTGKIILTNNILPKYSPDYLFNYSALINPDSIVGESSLYLLLKILSKLNVKDVILAGFDGFSKYTHNYYDNKLQFYNHEQNGKEITVAISEQLNYFQKYLKISFLTKSDYTTKEFNNV